MAKPPKKSGRPSKKKAAAFKTMAWFNAVAQASGLTAYALDLKYADKRQVRRTIDGILRPCIWDKYRRGSVGPSIEPRKGKSESIVQRVERDFPGAARWLNLPLWRLLEAEHLSMEGLLEIFRGLGDEVRGLLLYEAVPETVIFWRKSWPDTERLVETLFQIKSLDATTALLGLIRLAEICQDQSLHQEAYWALITLLEELRCEPPLQSVLPALRLHLIREFCDTSYCVDGEAWYKPFVDPSQTGGYQAMLDERKRQKERRDKNHAQSE